MEGRLPVVCYSMGTMKFVLDKLTERKNRSSPADEVSMLTEKLKEDLLGLKEDFCDKVAGQPVMHKQVKVCMKQVRELVFSIEDWIDTELETDLVVDPRPKFDYFQAKIHGARERFTTYFDLHKPVPTETDAATIKITINPRLLLEEKSCPGLFDGAKHQLVKYLTDEKEDIRRVVSVVGREGLGKTTLAKEIYSELKLCQLFQCQAFVSVGRTTPTREILYNILSQVKPRDEIGDSIVSDVHEISTHLQEYLATKRYFIILDGIWSTWAWKVINCALPVNRGSRILTTTCIMDVGKSCSSYPNDLVYQMEALCKKNSRSLFRSKIVTLQEEEKGACFAEVSDYILNICSGIPLAIIVAAGLLARKSKELAQLKMLGEYMYTSLKHYSTSQGMTKILHMSFADLCLALRSCFLYLSVFPENYTIMKDRLILLWGAEGFIPRIDEECLLVTGERYFNELICRGLVQPVFKWDDDQAVGCTVHIVILDFIRSISREENCAIMAADLNSSPFPCDTIRRFSLDCGNKEEAGILSTSSIHLTSTRSLIVYGVLEAVINHNDDKERYDHPPPSVSSDDEGTSGDVEGMLDYPSVFEDDDPLALRVSMINLSAFKLLRVLDLEDATNLQNHHLQGIGGLVLLRYLGLGGSDIHELPEEIGNLKQLETLCFRRNDHNFYPPMVKFPGSVVNLQRLTHLILDKVDVTTFWEMPELEVVSGIRVDCRRSLGRLVRLLMKSERLRMLCVSLEGSIPEEADLISFFKEIVMSSLQFVSLCWNHPGDNATALLVDSWDRVTAELASMFEPQRFELRISGNDLMRVPHNMGSLASLTHLHINFGTVKAEDFLVLGGLTNLVVLNLDAYESFERQRFIISGGIFPCLKVLCFKFGLRWIKLEFKKGAMPQLQRLARSFQASGQWYKKPPYIGIEHLTCLTQVNAIIDCRGAAVSEVEALEAAIRGQVSEIASKPTLELSREYADLMFTDKQGEHSIVSPRQVTEGTSIRQLEDDDQIWEEEEQNSIPVPSRRRVSQKAKTSTLEASIEDEDQMWMDEGKDSIPSKKQVFENFQKRKLRRSISSLSEKMKDVGRKLIGRPKLSEKTNKYKFESSIEEEDQMRNSARAKASSGGASSTRLRAAARADRAAVQAASKARAAAATSGFNNHFAGEGKRRIKQLDLRLLRGRLYGRRYTPIYSVVDRNSFLFGIWGFRFTIGD